MKPGFRPSMTWLHDWSGLVMGWLLFAIALAGTLSVFREEIGDWARPEASCCVTDSVAAGTAAVRWLSVNAATSPTWYVQPADARSTTSYAVWSDPRAGYVQKWLDARSGSPERIRDTLGGDFFYRLHFELELPYPWGRILSASAALTMLLALLTGIVAHRRIFVDFFTFRPRKGQRSWLDAHNLLAVTALPFHLMIAFTGALTLAQLIMPWGLQSAYRGDQAALSRDLYPATLDRPAAGRAAPLAPIGPILAEAERRFGGGLLQFSVAHPGDAAAVVTVVRAEDARIGVQAETLSFDGPSGRLIAAHDEHRPAIATYDVLYGLHTARFAGAAVRWLYFVSGLALTAMIGAGLLLWTAKRRRHRDDVGIRFVERLNLGFVAGTPIAFAAFFLANRLLPTTLAHRSDWEGARHVLDLGRDIGVRGASRAAAVLERAFDARRRDVRGDSGSRHRGQYPALGDMGGRCRGDRAGNAVRRCGRDRWSAASAHPRDAQAGHGMIMASVVALLAIMLIAGGTPRQAAELFGGRLDRSRRRALRLTGVVLLAGSFGIALIDDDRARHGIAWIGTLGVESLAVALLLTLRANRAKH